MQFYSKTIYGKIKAMIFVTPFCCFITEPRLCFCWSLRYEFGSSQWSVVQQRGTNIPPNTYGHSLVSYKNSMYLYGGAHTFDSNNVTNALWRFDPARLEWAQVSHKEARVDCHLPTPLCPPVPAVGHAAVMVNQSMLVFFGHHPILGYLNMVQVRCPISI